MIPVYKGQIHKFQLVPRALSPHRSPTLPRGHLSTFLALPVPRTPVPAHQLSRTLLTSLSLVAPAQPSPSQELRTCPPLSRAQSLPTLLHPSRPGPYRRPFLQPCFHSPPHGPRATLTTDMEETEKSSTWQESAKSSISNEGTRGGAWC